MKRIRSAGLHADNFYRTLVILALPIMVQNFIVSSLNMIDTLMIGAVGENEVAALGIANQYFFLFNLFITGAAGGCGMFTAQFWGRGDSVSIRKVTGVGTAIITALGLAFLLPALIRPELVLRPFSSDPTVLALGSSYLRVVCLSYIPTGVTLLLANTLRSMGNAKLPMLISALAIVINASFNYVMIFGKLGFPVLGVRGAAYATLLARCVEMLLLLLLAFRRGSALRGRPKEFIRMDRPFLRSVLLAMLPVILNDACWGLGSVLYTVAYGKIGTQALAAVQICTTIQNLFLVVCFSMASASLVMVGNQIGAGRRDAAVVYSRRFTWLSLLTGLLLGAVVFLCAPAILGLFNVSAQVTQSAVNMLRIFSFIAPIRVLNVVLIVGVFRGGGDASFALKAEGLTMWCIGVPLAFLGAMAWHLSVEQVVLLTTAEEIVKGVVALIRLRGNRWVHDITQPSAR